jgi:hypothetical protein
MEEKGKLVNSVLVKILGITAPVVWLENNFNEVCQASTTSFLKCNWLKARTLFT